MEPISDSDLELLHQKHGHEPLIHLVRMLVVAVDQTPAGSQEREKTLQLLKFLTKQDNISPSSSSWLDWLESVDENDLSWDELKPSSTESFSSGRKVVEMDDMEPSSERPKLPPMSKEQMIWAKALERQENKNSFKRHLFKLAILSIILGFAAAFWFYAPTLRNLIQDLRYGAPERNVNYTVSPMDLWGNYQSNLYNPNFLQTQLKSLSEEFLNSLEEENMPLQIREWLALKRVDTRLQPSEVNAIFYLGLRELEHRYFGEITKANDLQDWNNLTAGHRHWKFHREIKGEVLYQGNFVENFTKTSQGWDIQIKKLIEKNGIAHRIILDSNGLYAWSWRLIWFGHAMEGKVIRIRDGQFKIITSKAWAEDIEFNLNSDPMNYVPAIWCPSFFQLKPEAMIFPISGQICKGSIFWSDNEFLPTDKGFLLSSHSEKWLEKWVLQ